MSAAWRRTGRSLVPRNRRIDLQRPGVDATCHVLGLVKSLLAEVLSDTHTAAAVMAVDDKAACFVGFKLREAGWDVPHGDMERARDVRGGNFAGLSTVEQHELLTGIKHLLHGLNVDFDGEHKAEFRAGGNACEPVQWTLVRCQSPIELLAKSLPSPVLSEWLMLILG